MNKIYTLAVMLFLFAFVGKAQDILYSIDFESGLGDATIYGNGELVVDEDERFGTVYHNAKGGQAIRSNYLLLSESIFEDLQNSGKNELTISFWIHEGTAENYNFTPLFSAYGSGPHAENSWPMFVLQTRLLAQANIAGWCDFTSAQNDLGENIEDSSWLNDKEWHFYTAVYTQTTLTIYIDGVKRQSWTVNDDGDGGKFSGIYTNGSELKYIALGGNQAWNWADIDAAFKYDDLVIYSSALTQAEIETIIEDKLNKNVGVGIKSEVINKEVSKTEYYNITGQKIATNYDQLPAGIYIETIQYSDNSVKSSKVVKK